MSYLKAPKCQHLKNNFFYGCRRNKEEKKNFKENFFNYGLLTNCFSYKINVNIMA